MALGVGRHAAQAQQCHESWAALALSMRFSWAWPCLSASINYRHSITVFSARGHLFEVEYMPEAMKKGPIAVGIWGKDIVVLGVEIKRADELQDRGTVRKICALDDNVCLAFAGLTACAKQSSTGSGWSARATSWPWKTPSLPSASLTTLPVWSRATQQWAQIVWHLCTYWGFWLWWQPQTLSDWSLRHLPCLKGQWHRLGCEFLEKRITLMKPSEWTIWPLNWLSRPFSASGSEWQKTIELAFMQRDQPLKILSPEEIEKCVVEIAKEKEKNPKHYDEKIFACSDF